MRRQGFLVRYTGRFRNSGRRYIRRYLYTVKQGQHPHQVLLSCFVLF